MPRTAIYQSDRPHIVAVKVAGRLLVDQVRQTELLFNHLLRLLHWHICHVFAQLFAHVHP